MCNRSVSVLTFIQLDNFLEQLHSPSRGIYHHTASPIHHWERPSRDSPTAQKNGLNKMQQKVCVVFFTAH